MQTDRKCLATPRNAKDYLAKNEIPQLFECLMTGLMYHRPTNHIEYLQDCLDKIKKHGVSGVRWDMFLAARHVPLPPISPVCKEEFTEEGKKESDDIEVNIAYDTAIVVVIGGPGIDKHKLVYSINKCFPRFHYIELGKRLRERALTEVNKGVAKWKVAASLINCGELVPDDLALNTLVREINHNTDVSGIVIEGYPRNQKQLEDLEKFIGLNRINFILLIDSEEDTCNQNLLKRPPIEAWNDHSSSAITRRIANYKAYDLPVCKYFDDNQKLRIVDGDKTEEEIIRDILKIFRIDLADFEEEIRNIRSKKAMKYPDVAPPGSDPVTEIPELYNIPEESTRQKNLPQCPIVILLGGPGSGKTDVATEICNRYENWVHINVFDIIRHRIFDKGVHTQNWDCLAKLSKLGDVDKEVEQLVVEHWNISLEFIKSELKNLKNSTKGIILEGFPKDETQLCEFNAEIGKIDLVLLLDCDEYYMTTRLLDRNEKLKRPDDNYENILKRISYYKKFTLPLCRFFDERNRLNIIPGDRKFPDLFMDVINILEAAIMKNRCIEINPKYKESVQR